MKISVLRSEGGVGDEQNKFSMASPQLFTSAASGAGGAGAGLPRWAGRGETTGEVFRSPSQPGRGRCRCRCRGGARGGGGGGGGAAAGAVPVPVRPRHGETRRAPPAAAGRAPAAVRPKSCPR